MADLWLSSFRLAWRKKRGYCCKKGSCLTKGCDESTGSAGPRVVESSGPWTPPPKQADALRLRDTPEKQSTHSLPKVEHNTKSVLKETQRLIRGLYGLSRDGHARDGQFETNACTRVTGNVDLHTNRTFGKNFHACDIIARALRTNVR